ncbi:hypothetical protein OUZ56_024810 [Daphnia magna]|uniref:SET domain-containing protein n=1 Tax=Daphnia magna TaxID=35525 RepID=A0ABQ9ZI27_9CRUS|nr:hypothetical protein OUZ56_024810 [Daphnia magna]
MQRNGSLRATFFSLGTKKSFLSWELKLAVKEVNYDDEAYVMTTGVVGGYCTRFCNHNQSADDIDGVQV